MRPSARQWHEPLQLAGRLALERGHAGERHFGAARQLWEMSGLRPRDIRTAILYDHFTPFVLVQLEECGFCARGEAKDFVKDGNIGISLT
jgi:hypothetical protein